MERQSHFWQIFVERAVLQSFALGLKGEPEPNRLIHCEALPVHKLWERLPFFGSGKMGGDALPNL